MNIHDVCGSFEKVAEVSRYNRKQALKEVYRVAKIWDSMHATHMLNILMFTEVISCNAYANINRFLCKQIDQGWY